jgi:hypothetical protein
MACPISASSYGLSDQRSRLCRTEYLVPVAEQADFPVFGRLARAAPPPKTQKKTARRANLECGALARLGLRNRLNYRLRSWDQNAHKLLEYYLAGRSVAWPGPGAARPGARRGAARYARHSPTPTPTRTHQRG